METLPVTDEHKSNTKMVKSPPHIFDDQLFEQWPSVDDADKLELGNKSTNGINDKSKGEEKSVSFDFEAHETTNYSMLGCVF